MCFVQHSQSDTNSLMDYNGCSICLAPKLKMKFFKKAEIIDAEAVAKLVNSAYRGESSRVGWTTEADILEGSRTSALEVTQLIESQNTFILLCVDGLALLGSICIELEDATAHVGMFVVNPELQTKGIGKNLLAEAENQARAMWKINQFEMHVITLRHELIAFYERRGYQRTGIVSEFPVNPQVWQPKLAGLQLETLQKIIAK